MIPVVLSGGSGSRLWPMSRRLYPKQFLRLVSAHTLIQATLLRLKGIAGLQSPLIICNEAHRFLVAEQMREVGLSGRIMLEPVGRGTAPAIILAALYCLKYQGDDLLMVLPADHVIDDLTVFHQAIADAREAAEKGKLVTFGIEPLKPETGYGYIRKGEADSFRQGQPISYNVSRFVEKPTVQVAEDFLTTGEYLWNSGMFLFKASRYLEEVETFYPEMLNVCRTAFDAMTNDLDFIRVDAAYAGCPENSIDYAVMEKTDAAVVVPLGCGWSDVGSWSSVWELAAKDESGNVVSGDVTTLNTSDCYVRSEEKLISLVGVKDLMVVETDDAILVAAKDQVQNVKTVVAQLQQAGRSEVDVHRQVYRPWGKADSVDQGDGFQVKRITVNPGHKLSLQMHKQRAEHWIVVSGTALVTRGDDQFLVEKNESTFIPLGVTHRLENPGVIPLQMIEVQTGSYLGEDDIIRFHDTYGRY